MKRVKRAFIGAIALLLLSSSIVLAAISAPDTLLINNFQAFQSVESSNDQLYLATFEINYTANPDDDAGINYFFRLFDNGVEIATSIPHVYFDSGYDQGMIAFYFISTDAVLPAWGTANLTLELLGNPSLDWGGVPPTITYPSIDSWNTGSILAAAQVRTIAQQLENAWITIDLITPIQGVNILTEDGEAYFEIIMPNLRNISSSLFVSNTSLPDIPTEEHNTSYGDSVEDRWLTSANGSFDVTPVAVLFGTSRNWVSSLLWIGFSFGLLVGVSMLINGLRGKTVGAMGSVSAVGLRPALLLFGLLMIVGSFQGFMVFEAAMFCGILGGLALVLAFLWRNSA